MGKIIVSTVVAIAVIILGNIFFPVPQAAIEVAAEPIGLGPVLTNALFTSILLSIIIVIVAFFIGNSLKEQPGGLQNIVEVLIEALDDFVTNIAPKKWAPTFFPILATIFIYLLFANWISLLTPFLGSFGPVHSVEAGEGLDVNQITFVAGSAETATPLHHHGEEEEHTEEAEAEGEHGAEEFLTFALALISVVLTQVFGVWERGIAYFGNFIRLGGFAKKGIGLGFIDFAVGILEGVSEIAKVISFSFRLFGNIFAGEVVLIVISSLVSFLLILVFFGLEIFVGFIQAFVFFILSLVFFSMATQHHGEEH